MINYKKRFICEHFSVICAGAAFGLQFLVLHISGLEQGASVRALKASFLCTLLGKKYQVLERPLHENRNE